jgi:hypothetical protein
MKESAVTQLWDGFSRLSYRRRAARVAELTGLDQASIEALSGRQVTADVGLAESCVERGRIPGRADGSRPLYAHRLHARNLAILAGANQEEQSVLVEKLREELSHKKRLTLTQAQTVFVGNQE